MVEKGRNSKLAQRVVRSRSKEREGGRGRENWRYWQQREGFKGQEIQIRRKRSGLALWGIIC